MYFVYFFGGKIFSPRHDDCRNADKEEHIQAHTWNGLFHDWQLSYRRPVIIKINSPKASQRFFLDTGSVASLPFANIKKTLDSPHVGIKNRPPTTPRYRPHATPPYPDYG